MEIEPFIYWVREREAIRIRKEVDKIAPPYTGDPILATYRFCCVRREDDLVTAWIRANIRDRFADNRYLWLMLCIARQINWPDTLRTLIAAGDLPWPVNENFKPEIMAEVMEGIARSGKKVFTGAYIIPASSVKGESKPQAVAMKTIGILWKDRERLSRFFASGVPPTMRGFHSQLRAYNGWGHFLAYQAVVDMRFCRSLLADAPDRETWAAAGPGTIHGLNRLHGRSLDYPLGQGDALSELRALWPQLRAEVEMDFSDVPNVCCEVDKYLRVKNGEGKPRNLYVPGRGC